MLSRQITRTKNIYRNISTRAMHLNEDLATFDPEIYSIIQKEKERQRKNICLIASENFAPKFVLDAIGSVMTNKYSEGYPNARYYGGNEYIDQAELLCQKRALEAFRLNPEEWGVNVQPLSGSPCNFQVYSGLLDVHDRIMALDLPHGGHLSHGYQLPTKKVSMVSKYFECLPYRLDTTSGRVDYSDVKSFAMRFRPKLLIAGTSAYSRHLDYAEFRQIANDAKIPILMADMAHISGLVAAGVHPSPFEHCDIVTTTTHKSLRGPRGAMIFYRKGLKEINKKGEKVFYDYEAKINASVFPGLQGGPHNHIITALASSLKHAQSSDFVDYQKQVLANSKTLSDGLIKRGFDIVSGGTDNHLVLVDLRSKGIGGAIAEKICDATSITLNKNTIPVDVSAMKPSGLRIGSPAMTSRGLIESDFDQIAEFINRSVDLGVSEYSVYSSSTNKPTAKGFEEYLASSNASMDLSSLRREVESFASSFDTVGF